MKLNTCAAVLSYFTNLEEETAKFYENLAKKLPEGSEIFLSFSKENKKNKTMAERAYYSVITDALEACFSFGTEGGFDTSNFIIKTELPEKVNYLDALKAAMKIEETIKDAYIEATKLSESLMADLPRAFKMIVKKREDRINKLKTLIEK